jgi:PKD repeat protein
LWNFGDDNISTLQNPEHTYSEAGYYSVCLTVSDSLGTCVNMTCQTIKVGNNSNALWMLFNYLPDTTGGKAAGSVEFRGAAYGDPSRVIWSFGDSTLDSNSYNVSHTYQSPGYYMVGFQGNNQQVANTAYQLVNVAAGTNALQCRFGYTQAATNKKAAGSVEFRGAAYGDPSRCVWTFGDGDGDTTTLYPNHIYDTAGLYYVCLTVTNVNTQQTHTYCQWIEVTDSNISIKEKTAHSSGLLKVYPNPAQDKVYMQFEVQQKAQSYAIVITDLAGREVHQYNGSTEAAGMQLLEWNCKHIPAGSYVIHFSSAALQTNQKLLITK